MDVLQGKRSATYHPTKRSRITDIIVQAYGYYLSLDPYLRPLRRAVYELQARLYPILLPYLNRTAVLAQDSPAILTVGILLLFLLMAMQVFNFVRRVMAFWLRRVMRVTFCGGIVMLGAAVYQRGMGRTAEDVGGWAQEINDVWWREYRRWEGYQNHQRTPAKATWR